MRAGIGMVPSSVAGACERPSRVRIGTTTEIRKAGSGTSTPPVASGERVITA